MHDKTEIPSMFTLEPSMAGDFLDNMVLAAKDGNLKEWAESVTQKHIEDVRDTIKDLTVACEYYHISTGGVQRAVSCYMRHAQRTGDPATATICAPCAMALGEFAMQGSEFLQENATPQQRKVLAYAQELMAKAALASIPMLETMAQAMATELGLDIKEARKQVGLSEDGKSLLNKEGEAEQTEPEKDGWAAPPLED